ncbi:MAG: hypothetical protein JF570_07225 [Caulobacter sp.]|nr:hypothetical protein [Caulobacter sp.]
MADQPDQPADHQAAGQEADGAGRDHQPDPVGRQPGLGQPDRHQDGEDTLAERDDGDAGEDRRDGQERAEHGRV